MWLEIALIVDTIDARHWCLESWTLLSSPGGRYVVGHQMLEIGSFQIAGIKS